MSIARHSAYNLAGSAVPLLVALITIPLYLDAIGLDRYGILSIALLFLGYFNLFDLGLGRAIAHRLAGLSAQPEEGRSAALWSAALLSLGFAVIGTALFVPLAYFGLDLVRFGSTELRTETIRALPWLAACLPFGIANSVLTGALEGRQRFLHLNLITSFGTVVTATAPLVVAMAVGPALPLLIAAALGARAFTSILLVAECFRSVPILPHLALSRKDAVALLRFGKWAAVSNVVGPILAIWDRYVVGVVIGAAAVAIYVIPFNLVLQLSLIPSALMRAAFPRMVGTDAEEQARLAHRSWSMLSIIATLTTLVTLALVGPFLHLWIGEDTARASAPVAYILLFGMWTNMFAWLPFYLLSARGQPRIPALLHIAELIPYALILYLCLTNFGLVGAALAWSIRTTADGLLLFRSAKLPSNLLLRLIPYALLLIAAAAIALIMPVWSPLRWASHALIMILACYLLLVREPDARRDLWSRLKVFLRSYRVPANR